MHLHFIDASKPQEKINTNLSENNERQKIVLKILLQNFSSQKLLISDSIMYYLE